MSKNEESTWTRIRIVGEQVAAISFALLIVIFLIYQIDKFTDILERKYPEIGLVSTFFLLFALLLVNPLSTYFNNKYITDKEKELKKEKSSSAILELGRINLEKYLNINLQQSKWIFWFSVIIFFVGSYFIFNGIQRGFDKGAELGVTIVSTISGIIINFISASFLVIYKSTSEQAKDYVKILEKINSVTLALQIMESLEDSDSIEKNNLKSQIISALLDKQNEIKSKVKDN